jgi:hypothetical protein
MTRRPAVAPRFRRQALLSLLSWMAAPLAAQELSKLELLLHPEVESAAELAAHVEGCRLLRGLALGLGRRSQEAEERQAFAHLVYVSQLCLDFMAPGSPGELTTIDLATSPDPAVFKLRAEVGLPPPRGWVFVRTYQGDMPPLVAKAFEDEKTSGVTLLSHYVALRKDRTPEGVQGATQHGPTGLVLSHELVHAYIKGSLGAGGDPLPRWFHEGCAIYLSGSNVRVLERIERTGRGEILHWREPTDEYVLYSLEFEFLDQTYGPAAVHEYIRQALRRRSASAPLLPLFGISSSAELARRAQEWDDRRSRRTLLLSLLGVGFLLGLFFLKIFVDSQGGIDGIRLALWARRHRRRPQQPITGARQPQTGMGDRSEAAAAATGSGVVPILRSLDEKVKNPRYQGRNETAPAEHRTEDFALQLSDGGRGDEPAEGRGEEKALGHRHTALEDNLVRTGLTE